MRLVSSVVQMEILVKNGRWNRTFVGNILILATSLSLVANAFAQKKSARERQAIKSQATVVIQTIQDLQNISNNLAGNYLLANNIDASATATWNSGVGFLPIGSDATPFTGTLNGNGYTISGLFIYSGASEVGLFGTAGAGAVIENINLTGVNITGTQVNPNEGDFGTGALVGHLLNGQVINCTVSGMVTGNYVGGLVGVSNGSTPYIGGAPGGSITNSSANVTVVSTGSENTNTAVMETTSIVGGLVGFNYGTITGSTAAGSVANSWSYAQEGGLVGYNFGTISNSQASASVADSDTSPPVDGDIFDQVGGLAGLNWGTISGSHATGAVSAQVQEQIGGLVGSNACVSGGLCGEVLDSFATGSVNTAGNGAWAGGLVGVKRGNRATIPRNGCSHQLRL